MKMDIGLGLWVPLSANPWVERSKAIHWRRWRGIPADFGETPPERTLRAIFPAICSKCPGKERLIILIFLSSTFVIWSNRSDVFGCEKQHWEDIGRSPPAEKARGVQEASAVSFPAVFVQPTESRSRSTRDPEAVAKGLRLGNLARDLRLGDHSHGWVLRSLSFTADGESREETENDRIDQRSP